VLDPAIGDTPVDTFDLGSPGACLVGGGDWSGDGDADMLCLTVSAWLLWG
jgi:hypothetical protein